MWGEHKESKAVLCGEKGEASREPALEGEGGGDCVEVKKEVSGEDEDCGGGKAECDAMSWGEGGAGCERRREAASVGVGG